MVKVSMLRRLRQSSRASIKSLQFRGFFIRVLCINNKLWASRAAITQKVEGMDTPVVAKSRDFVKVAVVESEAGTVTMEHDKLMVTWFASLELVWVISNSLIQRSCEE